MVIDAVPEPAIALDGYGQIVHANRLAEEQFGARRRGGHIASMSRDPGLLAAVEEALQSRQAGAVELQARVPVERRLLATLVPLRDDRRRPLRHPRCSSPSATSPSRTGWPACAPISSPTPAMS